MTAIRSDEQGLSTVEYIIILFLLAVSGLAIWRLMGDTVTGKVDEGNVAVRDLDPSAGGGGAGGNGGGTAGGGASGSGGSGGGTSGSGGGAGGATASTPGEASGAGGASSAMGGGGSVPGAGGGRSGGTVITSAMTEGEAAGGATMYVAPGTDDDPGGFFDFGVGLFVLFGLFLAVPIYVVFNKSKNDSGGA